MASRKDRVPALILKNISEIIQFEVKSKSIGFVTVTDVVVSNDFSHAKVYVTFLLNTIAFDKEDVIRTSGVTATTETDVEVTWADIFGGEA